MRRNRNTPKQTGPQRRKQARQAHPSNGSPSFKDDDGSTYQGYAHGKYGVSQ